MPALGTTKIPNAKKAKILAQKRAHQPREKIAAAENVSKYTVTRIKEENQPPEVIALADRYASEIVGKLKELAFLGADTAIKKIHETSAKDATIITATAIDKIQLLTNNPTSIVQNVKDEQFYLDLIYKLATDHKTAAEDIFRRAVETERIPREFVEGIEVKLLGNGK